MLSLGAGVQSTSLLVMAAEGLIDVEVAVFADTHWEPRKVYEHLWAMAERYGDRIPIIVDTAGDLRAAAIGDGNRQEALPSFLLYADGTQGRSSRSCTFDYKTSVVRRVARRMGGGPSRAERPVVMLLGFSWDEMQRMKDSDVGYITHEYPLIDQRMDRTGCMAYLELRGIRAPRSACLGCPNHGDSFWRSIEADELAATDEADRLIRERSKLTAKPFTHRSMLPLAQAVERVRAQGQMFDEDHPFECGSSCGT